MTISDFISNDLSLNGDKPFAAILGANPSEGARSPLLWNAAFDAHGLDWRMVPMDVTAASLPGLLAALDVDGRFIGGAIAVPHKEAVAAWLSDTADMDISDEALKIGAVNSLYRNAAGRLAGTNTDGEGALLSLRARRPELAASKILQIGFGGAGKAVAAYLAGVLNDPSQLSVAVRDLGGARQAGSRLGVAFTQWPPDGMVLDGVDAVVNCTSIGARMIQDNDGKSLDLSVCSPLADLDAAGQERAKTMLGRMNPDGLVFDIIYDPDRTILLQHAEELGIATINGAGMNLEQAVIAFGYALGDQADMARTRTGMDAARRS